MRLDVIPRPRLVPWDVTTIGGMVNKSRAWKDTGGQGSRLTTSPTSRAHLQVPMPLHCLCVHCMSNVCVFVSVCV